MRTRRWFLVLALVALLAACGGDEADTGGADATEPTAAPDTGGEQETPDATAAPESDEGAPQAEEEPAEEATGSEGTGAVTLSVVESDLGEVLADGEGMVLYLFDPDEAAQSTCYDDCASSWPPLAGSAEAGDGVDGSLIGTTERTDGEMQVTYGGWPLYYFSGDAAPGDVNGQGLQDVWWLVSPEAERVTATPSAAAFDG